MFQLKIRSNTYFYFLIKLPTNWYHAAAVTDGSEGGGTEDQAERQ